MSALGRIFVVAMLMVASASVRAEADQVERGRYLVRAGDCIACHTRRGGPEYAGGRAVPTPFGEIYSTNLTPDEDTGLGRWSADEFWSALHEGRGRDGRLLYPAFPYTNYTLIRREDSDAIFAYLRTLPAVRESNRAANLRFPYNTQIALRVWRWLYFEPGEFEPDPTRNDSENRGAYLVEGLGHCDACHSPRTRLGATDRAEHLAGAMIPMLGWYAPSLRSGRHEHAERVRVLGEGASERAVVTGPMSEVVYHSLQYLQPSDLGAIMDYLNSLPRTRPAETPGAPAVGVRERQVQQRVGADIYAQHCADCHGEGGEGRATDYPPLAGNVAVTADTAANPIRTVLLGGFAPGTRANPRPYGMPPFGQALTDAEIAAVLSYVRGSWGNASSPVSTVEVRRQRSGY